MSNQNNQIGLPLDAHQELQAIQNAQSLALNQRLERFESAIVAAQAEQQRVIADREAARDDQMSQLVAAMADLQSFVKNQSQQQQGQNVLPPSGTTPSLGSAPPGRGAIAMVLTPPHSAKEAAAILSVKELCSKNPAVQRSNELYIGSLMEKAQNAYKAIMPSRLDDWARKDIEKLYKYSPR